MANITISQETKKRLEDLKISQDQDWDQFLSELVDSYKETLSLVLDLLEKNKYLKEIFIEYKESIEKGINKD